MEARCQIHHHASGLRQQIGKEDDDDGNRSDIADEEPEDAEDSGVCAESAAVGEFVIDVGLLEAPAYEEDCEKTAEGHQDI